MEIVVLPENPPRPPKSVWATIYIGKGKKEKLSRMDIAGFLYKKGNLTREDVGAIDVKEHYALLPFVGQSEATPESYSRGKNQRNEDYH